MILNLAGCVVLDESQKVLLLHRNKDGLTQWELPGGKIEDGEDLESAAIRELHEELGVTVKLVKKLGSTHFVENDTNHFYTWFLAEIMSGRMRIGEPQTFDDLKSFSIEDMSNIELSNNMVKLREAILSGMIRLA